MAFHGKSVLNAKATGSRQPVAFVHGAFSTHDPNDVVELYAPDAILYDPQHPGRIHGTVAIREGVEAEGSPQQSLVTAPAAAYFLRVSDNISREVRSVSRDRAMFLGHACYGSYLSAHNASFGLMRSHSVQSEGSHYC